MCVLLFLWALVTTAAAAAAALGLVLSLWPTIALPPPPSPPSPPFSLPPHFSFLLFIVVASWILCKLFLPIWLWACFYQVLCSFFFFVDVVSSSCCLCSQLLLLLLWLSSLLCVFSLSLSHSLSLASSSLVGRVVRHPFWIRLCCTALIAPLGSLAFLCFLARVSFHPCCRRFENRLCSLDSSFPARLLQVLASSYLLACLFVCRLVGLCVWLSSNSRVCVFLSLSLSLCVCFSVFPQQLLVRCDTWAGCGHHHSHLLQWRHLLLY